MKTNKISRLKKVKLFLIYNITNKHDIRKETHSNANNSIRSKECDF